MTDIAAIRGILQIGESLPQCLHEEAVHLPCRNAVAISDGPRDRSTGRIFFYLTDFDQTAVDLKVLLS